MTSVVSIWNLALVSKLGQKRVSATTEDSAEARACLDVYSHALAMVTADHNWRHAKRILTLSETTNDREDEWGYAYTRPSDCLRVIRLLELNGVADPRAPIPAEYVGSTIYTDQYQARLEYLRLITDPDLFPPAFINALSSYLAAMLVQPLQLDPNLHLTWMQKYVADRNHAVAMDGNEAVFQLSADDGLPDWMLVR